MKERILGKRAWLIFAAIMAVVGGYVFIRTLSPSRWNSLSDAELEKSGQMTARRELLRRAVARGDGEAAARAGFALVRMPSASAADYLSAAEGCKSTRHSNHAFWLFNEGVRRFPHSVPLMSARATFLKEQRNAPEELSALKAWLAATPNAVEPNVRLGDFHFKNGAVEMARGHYERALRANPKLPIAARRVALAAYFRGDLGEAEALARKALALAPEEAVGHLLLGQVLISAGKSRRDEAAAALEVAAERDPNSASAQLYLGVIAEEAGDWHLARQRFARCLEISPQNGAATYHLAGCLEALDLAREAAAAGVRHRQIEAGLLEVRQLNMRLASNPGQPDVGLRLARLYRKLGQRSDALEAYRRVVNLRPLDRRLREEMGPLLTATEAGR